MFKLDFQDQTILVTGASRGIGRQIALDLSACGARLIVTATDRSRESALRDELGESMVFLPVDFSDRDSTDRFLREIGAWERIDACVNNAGMLLPNKPVFEIESSDWDEIQAVNLKAPFLVTQAVARVMRRQGYGRIVNVTSLWGHITMPGRAPYTSSKFGLRGLTTSAAADLAPDNILVNAVAPGFTLTEILKKNFSPSDIEALAESIPLGRLANTAEISRAVLFLASALNTYITGQSLVIDGGYSIV
uniref:3-oxoacyl-[acyl-carrier protein] reductase n=1 Tax=Candidatus Kentrum sp. FM TaxID=2126340 RepID=A0A450U146_9GAMM|nr:MAG: 3-oxoacyl-[acyl-carrier protein] reductase [Candidatus Kentron sp. FM]VFJ76035.1 MAG: 3-oxoacyl-[acyl-carrier protein] reductase [Candidatus Kentron sp. FM]VFK17311.1 MAG: 3-oxoacyl-[acyl-carrier protein] reductase [Candidatus Kentron sp. FM]